MSKATKIEGVNLHGIEASLTGDPYKVTITFKDAESERVFSNLLSESDEVPVFNLSPVAVYVSSPEKYIELIDEKSNADLFFMKGFQDYEVITKTLGGQETSHGIITPLGWSGRIPR